MPSSDPFSCGVFSEIKFEEKYVQLEIWQYICSPLLHPLQVADVIWLHLCRKKEYPREHDKIYNKCQCLHLTGPCKQQVHCHMRECTNHSTKKSTLHCGCSVYILQEFSNRLVIFFSYNYVAIKVTNHRYKLQYKL